MRNPQFETGSFYHIYNRGVEKRDVFGSHDDYFRFIHDLFEFNDEESAVNLYYKRLALKSHEVEPRKISARKILVEIIAFCLMPNHFHLLVRQHRDGGVTRFMQKLGTGYTMYFNQKRERVGGLFQGKFKAIRIEKESHFLYLPHYIHLNPLDLTMPSWREGRIASPGKALAFLDSYRWSSYRDFTGQKNFPSLLSQHLIRECYGSPSTYQRSLREWIREISLEGFAELRLEG